ncbi:patatin-like phospholipase family protein, putative [Ichthyophthirius multifiliis]|uniref:Patatin-like phospholipase family protein, putative n=1 Tax=Ichthyophthirius multifiliis TaxID=5932 RepID=G0QMR5_ICHMU|nr:patatin-like phospholipase family protein, putative [Ichthyophthirius multifiliis]EGR33468.1 patatin-like phospholipase family protein, putative [Ichthyophthirius multifiliis]|eukprot:XP_004037454.1 patatin-like phospholipase family protein, putative [Ichthyophthirius multifiliis]
MVIFSFIKSAIEILSIEIIEDIQIIKQILVYEIQNLQQQKYEKNQRLKLIKKMNKAITYEEWFNYSKQLDNLQGTILWKKDPTSPYYNYEYIQHLRDELKLALKNKDSAKIIHNLRSHPYRNIGNILNPTLYQTSYIGTKNLIEEYQQILDQCIQFIAENTKLSTRRKLEFFIETRHALGRTALLLSGGGKMAMYHIGVVKTLYEQGLFPTIISGSSAGSIIASFICCKRYDQIPNLYNGNGQGIIWDAFYIKDPRGQLARKLKRFFEQGVLLDVNVLYSFVHDNLGDLTFQEAYDKTGFILNITVTSQGANNQDRILNFLSAPNVLIASAVCCSCGIPYIYGPSDLLCKNEKGQIEKYLYQGNKFLDGSIAMDLPMNRLAEFFNVNTFIVSQTNPFVVPFIKKGEKKNFIIRNLVNLQSFISSEVKHRCRQLIDLHLLPCSLGKLLNIVTQSYHGSIAIYPVPKWQDYANLLDVPRSDQDLEHFIIGGARKSFELTNYIRAYMLYEQSLERGYAKVKKSIQQKKYIYSGINNNDDFEDNFGNESVFVENYEEEDELRNAILSESSNLYNLYSQQKKIRTVSFFIPRTKSKELIYQLNQKYRPKKLKKQTLDVM